MSHHSWSYRPVLTAYFTGMRYEAEGGDPANAGLQHARVFLEPVKDKHSWITYSDLWTLAGVVAIKEMGGPDIAWKGGRTDFVDDSRLPPRLVCLLLFGL